MKNITPTLLSMAAATVLTVGLLAQPATAHAASIIANIRVVLPTGQLITVQDTPDNRWFHRDQLSRYHYNRFIYDPARRAYIVRPENAGNYHDTPRPGRGHGYGHGGPNHGGPAHDAPGHHGPDHGEDDHHGR